MDSKWFTGKLAERELSQRGLARLMGMDPGAMSLTLRGKRKMTLEEAAQIAVLLDATTQDVLIAAGVDVRTKDRVRVVGYMTVGGAVIKHARGLHESAEGHSSLPPGTIAIQSRTQGSPVEHLDGWMLYVSGTHMPPTSVIGTTALVGVKGNGEVIGYVKRGYQRGSYNVVALCGNAHNNVEIAWASPVIWIRTA